MKTLRFNNNDELPAIGLGTWKSQPGEVKKAIKHALQVGYRHIDCAAIYRNEKEIGEALKEVFAEGKIKRTDVFITSKLWNNAHHAENVKPALEQSLKDLQLDYLDLYLMHWPVAQKPEVEGFPETDEDFVSLEEVPLEDTWEAMVDLKKEGLAKHVGVSNFSIKKLNRVMKTSDYVPEMNQIELHPYLHQDELVNFCDSNAILVTAYSPLGSQNQSKETPLLEHDTIKAIASKHNATPAQVLIKFHLERNVSAIPKSTNEKRIEQNLESQHLELDEDDMTKLKSLDKHFRYGDGKLFETSDGTYSNTFDE